MGGENLGPGHDVIVCRCNPFALSPISRGSRLSGMGRERRALIRETGGAGMHPVVPCSAEERSRLKK